MKTLHHVFFLGMMCLVGLGCGGGVEDGSGGGSTTTSTSTSTSEGGGGAGGDGSYHQGVYLCCAKGEGTACCEGEPQGTCFQYGGTVGDCAPEGDVREGKDICSLCCPGLAEVEYLAPDASGACEPQAPPSVLLCVACGDGVCGKGENVCNCPDDCK